MTPVRKTKPTTIPPLHEEMTDYVPPARFVVDAATASQIEARIASPRQPNAALRALFKK